MTPENKVKNALKVLLDEYGVYHFSPVTSGFGRSGIADVVGCYRGVFLAMECKAGKGKTTALQQRELDRVSAAGGYATVISDDPETIKALRAILEALK